jgi:hypothetical protein
VSNLIHLNKYLYVLLIKIWYGNQSSAVADIITIILSFNRNIDDVDKTMDEINEQTENMKQIPEALSAPIGAAADFDEVFVLLMPFQLLLGPIQFPTKEETFSSLFELPIN